ncbi:hypothetical protein H9Y04_41975 [Streptomyces sp. TRM66268-LWL]|uniref:Uncharacterized protein n=1 Tax=Streptomyces polyasparticus TaxID=2767826 RepID=A0ABR7SUC9_9ACTN|nr:hypothetical protein [Streptomyces polyasparticus]MBC9719106.1 hypothetical protein [Streptomyces polyasparticus]
MAIGHRMRRAVNVTLVLTAIAGTGWGGYETWAVLSARSEIDAACAELVPAGKVLRLPYAGGTVETKGEGIDPDRLEGECTAYSSEAGESLPDGGHRRFFTASVGIEPEADESTADWLHALDPDDRPYLDTPLGHGIPGIVTDSGVGVKLACTGGVRHRGTEVENVVATAVSTLHGYGSPFASGSQMGGPTRDLLASIAVDTANRMAERLGCADRLPQAPVGIPPAVEKVKPAKQADGTCAWYAKARRDQDVWLPDRAIGTPTDPEVWTEKCALLMSADGARKAERAGSKTKVDHMQEEGDWWASLQSWFGSSADRVVLHAPGDPSVSAEPGRAGRTDDRPGWWASSVCNGEPAVHTLSLGNHDYPLAATPHFAEIFRAYVQDVAARRGCTGLVLPDAAAFRSAFVEDADES